ncbi:AMP-binding protein [Peptococcaceae bacterium]|nr:AMP-binding protein [Peptococcaceae bacterium]
MDKIWLKHYDKEVPENIKYPDISLFEMFKRTAEKYREDIFIRFMGLNLTYQETANLIAKFAGSLADLGVKKGDKVAIHLPNCPQFIITYFATLKLRAIVVPCNPMYVAREMKYQLNNSGVENIVTLTRFYAIIKGLQKETQIKNIIVANIKDYFPNELKLFYTFFKEKKEGDRVTQEKEDHSFLDLLKKGNPAAIPASNVTPDDVAIYLYTGGTTGKSKGAVLTNRNLVANTHQCKFWMGDIDKSSFLVVLPLFHSFGMTVGMNTAILAGGKVVLLPRFDAEIVLKTISKRKNKLFPRNPCYLHCSK